MAKPEWISHFALTEIKLQEAKKKYVTGITRWRRQH
jgi:hypothetical protein